MTDDTIDKEELRLELRGIKDRSWEEWQMASEYGSDVRMGEAQGRAQVAIYLAGAFGIDITNGHQTVPMDQDHEST